MKKVSIFNKKLLKQFYNYTATIMGVISSALIFIDDTPLKEKAIYGFSVLLLLAVFYIYLWYKANTIKKIDINIEGTDISIITGDLFQQNGLKAIAFNEYFDTLVDNKIITELSLNGIFIKNILRNMEENVESLDIYIKNFDFNKDDILKINNKRNSGKNQKYRIGTICKYKDYLLTAFSKFTDDNRAYLTMPEYLEFMVRFWDQVNKVYGQQTVFVPIFGSGITRIKEHKNISDEELLKIMLWTFKISEVRFKYPARLVIVIHENKIDRINLFEIESFVSK